MDIESAVIVKSANGYTAYLRFTDPTYDEDITSDSRFMIYYLIDKSVRKATGKKYG